MIETKSAFISKIDDDTVKVILKPNARVSKEEYESFYPIYQELLNKDKDMKLFILIQNGARVEKKLPDFFKKVYNIEYKKAEAYMIISPVARMFLKLMIRIVGNKYPVRHFHSEDEAVLWLKSIN